MHKHNGLFPVLSNALPDENTTCSSDGTVASKALCAGIYQGGGVGTKGGYHWSVRFGQRLRMECFSDKSEQLRYQTRGRKLGAVKPEDEGQPRPAVLRQKRSRTT